MKIVGIAILFTLIINPTVVMAALIGTKHDMIASGFADGGGAYEVCVFCHTPHGAQPEPNLIAPLWNNTALDTVSAVYTSAETDFASTVGSVNATDALICLACHDATGVGYPGNPPNIGTGIVIDPGGTTTAMSPLTVIGGAGGDLSDDHPIGMDLGADPGGTDSYIRGIGAITTNFGGVSPFFGVNNTMWCSSCHDVHDNTNIPFLRKSNVGSALCKACHIK